MLDIPIFHVNGDDPEACVHVMRLATEYRQRFKSDVVMDLVCFRRYGHNEGDEPGYTQPLMYEAIRHHPPVSELYARTLAEQGRVSAEEAEAIREEAKRTSSRRYNQAKETPALREPSAHEGVWKGYRGGPERRHRRPRDRRAGRNAGPAARAPRAGAPGVHRPLRSWAKILERRRAMARRREPAGLGRGRERWPTRRCSGRGNARPAHRPGHGARHLQPPPRRAARREDRARRYVPLQHLGPGAGAVRRLQQPAVRDRRAWASSTATSLDYPDALVIWEAQFGDFANGAQVIIDQFIASAEDKWRRLSGLVLLLPHGYEGQGPEHSSARLERFLVLCAEDNIQVCYPTTPAQIFHLLRRQVMRPWRKPLVVMTPEEPAAARARRARRSDAFASGSFQRLISDRPASGAGKVTRLLLCTGKVAYDVLAARAKTGDDTVAIARLEQLYPFPETQVAAEMPASRGCKSWSGSRRSRRTWGPGRSSSRG